jgi:hypothetical protein
MNKAEKIAFCQSQLKFEAFIRNNREYLVELQNTPGFIDEINKFCEEAGDKVFGIGMSESEFQDFKMAMYRRFFDTLPFEKYPTYQGIYGELMAYNVHNGEKSAGMSAAVSVFYAILLLKLEAEED